MEEFIKNQNPMLQQAIDYATKKHAGQMRKGTEIPYITHPLKVMEILSKNGCSNNVIIAGILHDTLEDTNATEEEIVSLFGNDVLAIVRSETEDKTPSWKERKSHTIEHLKSAPLEVKLVCCADKLANLRDMSFDFSKIGDKLWERFKAPSGKADIAWYYTEVKNALEDLNDFKMYSEYCELCEIFFANNQVAHK
jgi:(p)ppGpp synthase/HD superfamily hydrolase